MTKHALVVGSQTLGLRGAIGDSNAMAEMLGGLDFKVELCNDAQSASRDGILAAYKRLIERAESGHAAVFYYSGHGSRAVSRNKADAKTRHSYQAIVPTDFEESTEDSFRGITDVELSTLLALLTKRTENATVFLDCCHSAAMSRDASARPKSLLYPRFINFERHIERAIAEGLPVELLSATGNTRAVRVVAAGESQSAYERPVGNKMVGTFTEALLSALNEARGHRVTWDAIGRAIRERVLAIHPMQRPDVEGPRRRYLFDVEEAPRMGMFTIVATDQGPGAILRGGKLHGVQVGDEYAVLPNGAPPDPALRVATATVSSVDAGSATATLRFMKRNQDLPTGAHAILIRSAAPKRTIQVLADSSVRDVIASAIERTERFLVTDASSGSNFASVHMQDGQLQLTYPSGVSVVPAFAYSAENVTRLVTNLRMLTAAHGLRALRTEGDNLPDSAVEIRWGRVDAGEAIELEQTGAVLSVGDHIFVEVTNRHPLKKKLYVSVFDIGLAQRIQQVTTSWPAGFELDPGETFTLGQSASGTLKGVALGWSNQLPEDLLRSESLVVIVTDKPYDLSALETPGATSDWATNGTRSAGGTPLQQLIRQLQYGGMRDVGTRGGADEYLVHHIDFELSPWRLPPPGKDFLLDDRPANTTQMFVARRAPAATRTVAIRITDLVVHDTRTWFGDADLRLDTLVITRLPKGSRPYRAETSRFKDVQDGKPLPLRNALVYHGDVRDFVDLRVWVSRDRDGSKPLTELLDEQANSAEFTTAATSLLVASGATPSASTLVAAVGATATLTTIAWRVLSEALPKSIGLYQTSLLAGEREGFGQGRHPRQGMFPAQGFSFAYEVVLV
jgi:hypothetical protein